MALGTHAWRAFDSTRHSCISGLGTRKFFKIFRAADAAQISNRISKNPDPGQGDASELADACVVLVDQPGV